MIFIEIATLITAVILTILWVTNPDGNYEPYTVLCTFLFVGLEIVRRRNIHNKEIEPDLSPIPKKPKSIEPYSKPARIKPKENAAEDKSVTFCAKCGYTPGSYSSCISGTTHNFQEVPGKLGDYYCQKCGVQPGSYSSCVGVTNHEFA
ncbi:MAG: hypothetical protein OEY52_09285 [Gammaproteobacteria bacterium]|nr:hypothetical protein [Gammaproteobacteria bacterium]